MSTTTNLALNEPAYNSTSPTWDQPLNYNATILDQMFGNTTGVSVSTSGSTTYTNITAPSSTAAGSTSQAMRFNLTGALAANQNVLLPQGVAGMWIVTNSTSGTYTVTMGSNNGSNAAAGTTVSVPQGYSTIVYCDGTNVKLSDDGILQGGTLPSLNVTGNTTLGTSSSNTLTVNATSTFSSPSTINATATFNGASTTASIVTDNILEVATISSSNATGTINFDLLTQSVVYYTANATGNFTLNIRGSSSTTLNSVMANGQSATLAFLNTNGSTPYYLSAVTIDGTSVTPKWQNAITPSSGNASSIDIYTLTIIKTASATYTILGSQVRFA
jgi:hypothetical protein